MQQGITITGSLANIKHVEEKVYKDRINPSSQKLQMIILNKDGVSLIDVSDKEFLFKKEDINKVHSIVVNYSVLNDTAYFRLVSRS